MAELSITHTPAEGTLVHGTDKGDGTAAILKAPPQRFHWSRRSELWYIPQSRDKMYVQQYRIDAARRALEDAGHTVTVDISYDDTRDVAERETDKAARAERRAEHHAEAAGNAAGRAEQRFATYRVMADSIPLGQPILIGHHSETRDRNYRARMHNHHDKGVEELGKADYHRHRAEAAEVGQSYRHNPRTIMRRIDKYEADRRRVQRTLDGRPDQRKLADGSYEWYLNKPDGEFRARLETQAADLDEQIAYWQAELDAAKAAGFRQFGPDNVSKGDYVRSAHGWHQVLRVNKKTVTVPHPLERLAAAGRTDTLPWDKVLDVRRADG